MLGCTVLAGAPPPDSYKISHWCNGTDSMAGAPAPDSYTRLVIGVGRLLFERLWGKRGTIATVVPGLLNFIQTATKHHKQ